MVALVAAAESEEIQGAASCCRTLLPPRVSTLIEASLEAYVVEVLPPVVEPIVTHAIDTIPPVANVAKCMDEPSSLGFFLIFGRGCGR